jgi:3',5'-cyclic AMP phosphodiesterase CpdA
MGLAPGVTGVGRGGARILTRTRASGGAHPPSSGGAPRPPSSASAARPIAATTPARRITRRRALAEALGGAAGLTLSGSGTAALMLAGCGASAGLAAASSGSTLASTWVDPVGDGQLRVGPGEPLIDRTELARRAEPVAVLATLAHVTDAHVLDASSPARVTFLDRLGAPFESTFRPQEAMTAQVLAGAANAVRALPPQLVIQGGDLIDNDQSNELAHALAVLNGGVVHPGSGPDGYYGVQSAFDPDPFYYRPDVDAPRHPGLLRAAVRPFSCRSVGAPVCPVLGDHDALVAGELVPTPETALLATGDRALWDLPPGLTVPPGVRLTTGTAGSPDGPPRPVLVNELLRQALRGPTVRVPADPTRRELSFGEVLDRLRPASFQIGAPPPGGRGDRLDYAIDIGPRLRLVVLDLVRRLGGSGGLVAAGQPAWLEQQLAKAHGRWVIVVSHQPLAGSVGGDQLLEVIDQSPQVIATLSGHTHRNEVVPQSTSTGGYWQISTASLIDYPQQSRALRVVATADGAVAIQTWMLDHVFSGVLGTTSRELSFLDAQGGRPRGFRGGRLDRNVVLHRR